MSVLVDHSAETVASAYCLRLRERYSGWDRQPFDSNSRGHVSVYQSD